MHGTLISFAISWTYKVLEKLTRWSICSITYVMAIFVLGKTKTKCHSEIRFTIVKCNKFKTFKSKPNIAKATIVLHRHAAK